MKPVLDRYLGRVRDFERRERMTSTVGSILTGSTPEIDRDVLAELLYFSNEFRLATKYDITLPAYSTLDDFRTNETEPWRSKAPVQRRPDGRRWSLLGKSIGFPIGIPASPLTSNAAWIGYFSRLGFNVLTYKTLRTHQRDAFAPPNWQFAKSDSSPLPIVDDVHSQVILSDPDMWSPPGDPTVSTANSFGIPSAWPEDWKSDIETALSLIEEDQILIVSVVGDVYENLGTDAESLIEDYALAAKEAEDAGAVNIEINLSSPNNAHHKTKAIQHPICSSPELAVAIIHAVRAELKPETRVLAKLAYLDFETLESLVSKAGDDVDAYAGINALQRPVLRSDGRDAFFERHMAGVSGFSIRNYALEFVRNLTRIRIRTGYPFEIVGMGGVTDPSSFAEMYNAGASVVQSATGAFANWRLADECVEAYGDRLASSPEIHDAELERQLEDLIRHYVAEAGEGTDAYMIAASMPVPPAQTFKALKRLSFPMSIAE